MDVIKNHASNGAVTFIAPNESIFSNHISVLAGVLSNRQSVNCVASAAIIKNGAAEIKDISEVIDFGHIDRDRPPGFGRFMFRRSSLPADLDIALPYVWGRPQAVMAGETSIEQAIPSSIVIDVERPFPKESGSLSHDTEIIKTFASNTLNILTGFAPKPSFITSAPVAPIQNIPPASVTLHGLMKFIAQNPGWIATQISLIKREGLSHRLKVFKKIVRI